MNEKLFRRPDQTNSLTTVLIRNRKEQTVLAHSLDADSFIDALIRLIARRGKPDKFFSDNGTNFVGAEKGIPDALQELDNNSINRCCSQAGFCRTFNPPLASHMGGAWERMIRTIGKVFKVYLVVRFYTTNV